MGKNKKKGSKEKDATDGESKSGQDKPLPKLVLKVKEKKLKAENSDGGGSVDGEHVHYRKKKKKHKHRIDEMEKTEKKSRKREATDTVESDTPSKRIHVKKEKEKKQEVTEPKISPFSLCLQNFHRNLQRKDVYGIFTYPVTDLIAPGYSKIIKMPMDFLTMLKKIENNEYNSIEQFKQDYVVMCNNAMLYNGSDTIYYKSAEKMLSIGLKMLSKEKMKKINKSIGITYSDSEDDVVQVDELSDVNIESIYSASESPVKKTPEKKRRDTTRTSTSAITASALAAAREARQKLLKKYPTQYYGYLSKDDQGNNSLNILNPDTTEDKKSVPVKIGKLAGKLATGIVPSQAVHKEDKKNKVIPVSYLLYGPYGSFGPSHDSSLSNMTKDESSLLLQAYGTESGVAYARSLLQFTKDSPYAHDIVDQLLNTLTNGEHMKLTKMGKNKTTVPTSTSSSINTAIKSNVIIIDDKTDAEKVKDCIGDKVLVDVSSLKTLNDIGIDVSFLDTITTPNENSSSSSTMKEKLDENASLLQGLKETQHSRLTIPSTTLNIGEKEQSIADSLTDNLKELMEMVAPQDVVSSVGLHNAMGSGESNTDQPYITSMDVDDTVQRSNHDNVQNYDNGNTS